MWVLGTKIGSSGKNSVVLVTAELVSNPRRTVLRGQSGQCIEKGPCPRAAV